MQDTCPPWCDLEKYFVYHFTCSLHSFYTSPYAYDMLDLRCLSLFIYEPSMSTFSSAKRQGRHACLKRIQLQVNSFSGDKKMFRNATLVDFDPFTYRHQLIFGASSAVHCTLRRIR